MHVMRKTLLVLSLLQLLFTSSILADQERRNVDEEVIHQEKPFLVRYSDGTAERYLVSYRGFVKQYAKESGESAEPFKGRIKDTRQCHWSIDSRVVREVFLVHRSGRQILYEKLTTRWNVPFTSKGSDFVLTELRPENCNDAWGRFESDINNARNRVRGEFQQIINRDLGQLKNIMKQELNANAIVESGR